MQALVACVGMGLGHPGLQGGAFVGAAALFGSEVPPEDLLGLGQACLGLDLQISAALGVAGQERLGDALDVGLAVPVHRCPRHAQAGGGLGPQRGLVDHAGGLELSVQGPGVQRPPHPVLTAHPSGNQDVGVQLGIAGPGGAVHEGGTDQSLGVDLADTGLALAGEGSVFFQVLERGGHGSVMGLPGGHAHLAPAQGPQGGQALGGREGQVPAGDPVGAGPDLVGGAEGLPGVGVHGVEQPGQLLG